MKAEMTGLLTRLNRDFPGHVDYDKILVQIEAAIETKIDEQVASVLNGYSAAELYMAQDTVTKIHAEMKEHARGMTKTGKKKQ